MLKTGRKSTWLLSAFISSLIPIIILLSVFLFPQLNNFSFLTGAIFTFGPPAKPLEGIYFTFILLVALTYWSIGFYLLVRSFSQSSKEVSKVSDVFQEIGNGALFFVFPLLVCLWALAINSGNLPTAYIYEENHGPWHYNHYLINILFGILVLPLISSLFCLLSFVVRPSIKSVIVLLSSVGVLLVLVVSHLWLID